MRTTLACVAGCAFLFVAGPVALVHCSGSSTSGTANSDAGHGSSGGNGSSSGATSSSSGGLGDDSGGTSSSNGGGGSSGGGEGGTSSGATDGGTSSGGEGGTSSSSGAGTPVPEGGVPSDPNSVSCGGAMCNTTSNYCCVEADGGATCLPDNSGACGTNAPRVYCNEAADCSGGICCTALTYGTHTSSCKPACSGPTGPYNLGEFQLCRTDAECGSADAGAASQKCVVQLCSAMLGGPQNVTVEACAYPGAGGWGPLPGCM